MSGALHDCDNCRVILKKNTIHACLDESVRWANRSRPPGILHNAEFFDVIMYPVSRIISLVAKMIMIHYKRTDVVMIHPRIGRWSNRL